MAKFDYRDPAGDPASPALPESRPALPYVVPLFAFLLVMLPGSFGELGGINWETFWKQHHPELYAAKTILAAILLWYFWPSYTPIRWSKLSLGALIGIVGTFLWIGTELAARKVGLALPVNPADIYNPDQMLGGGWQETAYLCIRVAGPSLVVPVMEELFFRDFLMRLLVSWNRRVNFQEIPVGTFTWGSLLAMSVVFGLNHGIQRFFFAGFVYGLVMGLLLIRTKSLGACIVAHGVTNFTLYLYVIYTGDWQWM
ncbi:MAG TPA: CAAX prenyl protease-related protein [Phycisphaerae bacterium]|jgi:CAAX prenyl protease-like protein|nr:CAAX prenyl protease-related protein [Phycisphaerae bacterium]